MCCLVTAAIAFAVAVAGLGLLLDLPLGMEIRVSATKWIGTQGSVHPRCWITAYSLHRRNLQGKKLEFLLHKLLVIWLQVCLQVLLTSSLGMACALEQLWMWPSQKQSWRHLKYYENYFCQLFLETVLHGSWVWTLEMAASCQNGERLDTPAYCQSQLVGASADAIQGGYLCPCGYPVCTVRHEGKILSFYYSFPIIIIYDS